MEFLHGLYQENTFSQRTFNLLPSGKRKNIIDVIAYIVYIRDEPTNEQMNVYGLLKQKQ
jgi:hypothetical protein